MIMQANLMFHHNNKKAKSTQTKKT